MPSNALRFVLEVSGLPEPLRVVRFEGREQISQLFEMHITVASEDHEIGFASVVDQAAALVMRGDDEPRYLHGIISRFQQREEAKNFTLYQATLVPRAWRLGYRRDCRIFQVLTVPEIIEKVLKAAGMSADEYRFLLYRTYSQKEYSVQYRESDWGYICRLMEEEGLFCFFEHSADKDVLIIGDAPFVHQPIAPPETLAYQPSLGVIVRGEHISRLRYAEEVRPGKVTLRDFNFKTPALSIEATADAAKDTDLEIYDYPGEYELPKEGTERAKARLEDWQALREHGDGESNCVRFIPGSTFSLSDHPRETFNRSFLLTEVEHRGAEPLSGEADAASEAGYSNRFRIIPVDVPFRPSERTPKPTTRGVQTAIVVGPPGEEVYTDEFGRVKVQFHWDRQGRMDEHSSCWIRVSQLWAGQAYGAMYIPRIGHEVIIDFIEGDPDRPIIVGRVYHGTNVPPYALPGEKTKSTIKTNTSPGSGGSNELRFEDKKGAEEIYLHGQKDWNIHIENDKDQVIDHNESLHVKDDRSKTVGANEMEKIGVNKTIHVGANHTETIDGDEAVTVGLSSTRRIGTSLDESIGENKKVAVAGDHEESIGGKVALNVGKSSSESVGEDRTLEVGGTYNVTIRGDMAIAVAGSSDEQVDGDKTVTVGKKITMKSVEGTITLDKDGTLTITCKDLVVSASGEVKIEASSKVSVKSDGPVDVRGSEVKIKGNAIEMN